MKLNNQTGNKSILMISSANPTVTAGRLALDYYNALKLAGNDVDLLTKFHVPNNDEILSIYPYCDSHKSFRQWISIIVKLPFRIVRKILRLFIKNKTKPSFNHCFFYKNESEPPVSNEKLLNAIPTHRKYDFIFIIFWQEVLSAASLEALYDKYKIPILLYAVDYGPITGGCHFIGDCKEFVKGCGCCPYYKSTDRNDCTHANMLFKKRVYEKIKPVMFLNKYMYDEYGKDSIAIKNVKIDFIYPVINETIFSPVLNKMALRKEMDVPSDKKVIFFACQNLNDARKGITYVIQAINNFYKSLSELERKKIFIVTAGTAVPELINQIPFENKHFGYVGVEKLANIFQISDLYLSGAVIDAGPMMVNQALSCGVPVVAFKIGIALEVVMNQGTGYCAETRNADDFNNGIKWWYGLTESDYANVCKKCREIAIETTSYKACADKILNTYKELERI